ncbi:MAG TPA: VCBS domain-containing protein [Devosia sp.]
MHLPASADLSSPRTNGTSLEFIQPDGTVIAVPGGAVTAFTLFIGDIEVPDEVLVALLEAQGIETAAGPSSGDGAHGNFNHLGPRTVGEGEDFDSTLLEGVNGPQQPLFLLSTLMDPAMELGGESREDTGQVNRSASIAGDIAGLITEDALPFIQEDFTAADELDWGDNAYRNYADATGDFLTEYDRTSGDQSFSRSFSIADAGALKLSFDLFKIDHWEDEQFVIYLDDGVAFTFQPETAAGGSDGATGTFSVNGLTGTYRIASSGSDSDLFDDFNPGDNDRVYHVELVVEGAHGTIKLGFGNTLDEDFDDEDFGVDNICISSTELFTHGTLTIADPDPGESAFRPASVAGDNGYGTFDLDANGHWTYRADDTDPRIQALGTGDVVTDSFLARSADGSASQLVTVSIRGTNDAPIAFADGAASFVEDAGAIFVSPSLTLADIDSPILTGATVIIDNFVPAQDQLTFTPMPGISGEFRDGFLIFRGLASVADYQTLLRSVRYSNSSERPATADRLIGFQIDDGESLSSFSFTTVSVTPSDDLPVISAPAAAGVMEDGTLIFSDSAAIRVADPDSPTLSVTLTVTSGHLVPADTAGGATLTLTGSEATINAILATVKYVPTAHYSGPAPLTMITSDGLSSETRTIDIAVTAVADAPVIDVESLITTPVPAGDAFRLHQVTADMQNMPEVAALPDGGFVAVWQSYNQGGEWEEIYLRRFDASGTPIRDELHVNTVTASYQRNAHVAVLEDGRIVVSWESYDQDGSAFGIFARVFSSDGTPATAAEFQVNTSTQYNQQTPSVTALADGGYIFAWSSTNGTAYDIYTQRFSASGQPVGGETLVSAGAEHQTDPTITALPNGGYLVVWTDGWSGATATSTRFRMYDAQGNGGAEVVVNGGDHPDVALLAGGGFVVVSEIYGADGSYDGIFVRVYDAQGVAQTISLQANSQSTGYQEWPTVIGLADGGFLVAWSGGPQNAPQGIFAQRYDAAGNRIGGELQISTSGSNPQLSLLASGEVVVTWQGGGDSWGRILQASNAGGLEDQPFELPVTISLQDANGTPIEVLSELRISGLPEGFSLEAGERDPSTGDWVVDRSTQSEIDYLDAIAAHTKAIAVTPAAGFNGGLALHIAATSSEPSNGSTATTHASVNVSISPVDEPAAGLPIVFDTDPGVELPVFTDHSTTYIVDDLTAVDLIADYDFDEGDRIDLSAVLDGVGPEDIADFIRYVDGTLSVDTDGSGPIDFVAAAKFSAPPDQLALILDNGFEVVIGAN